jgi:hypothetical protein
MQVNWKKIAVSPPLWGSRPEIPIRGRGKGLIKAEGLPLSVSTLSILKIEYSKQTPMQANRVYECVDIT